MTDKFTEKVEQAEGTFTWLVQNVIRGTWFRRVVFLFAVTLVLLELEGKARAAGDIFEREETSAVGVGGG
jgi:hypothetical protein